MSMAKAKYKSPKNRKPVIFLVCEGRNQTERKYFNHFKERDCPYNLYIEGCEATDVQSMANKSARIFKDNDLDIDLKDHVFCLIDLDLDKNKERKLCELRNTRKYKNVEFIVSNPCFEVWLLYYFTKDPKVEQSSQGVKEQMKKYVSNYTESMDVISYCGLENDYAVAIDRAEKKNELLCHDSLSDKNPYTEVQNIVVLLKELCNSKN